jgi:DNA-binding transcriptional LysR family regulator
MHYDLTDLRLFLNIGETENLTRAAERSYLSLPAASNRIKQLEDAFKTQLLIRQAKGVQLTSAGHLLLTHAREVFRELECLHSDLQPFSDGVKGRIRLLANTTATHSFLADALAHFLTNNPNVDVELEEQLSQEIITSISSGRADLGIVAGTVATAGLEVLHLRRDDLIVIASINHALPSFKTVSFVELLDQHRFVGLNELSAIQSFLDRIAGDRGKRMSLRIRVGSFEAMCRMVEAGAGIAVVPLSCALSYANRKNLRMVSLTDEWARRELRLCYRAGQTLPRFALRLVEVLSEAARKAH